MPSVSDAGQSTIFGPLFVAGKQHKMNRIETRRNHGYVHFKLPNNDLEHCCSLRQWEVYELHKLLVTKYNVPANVYEALRAAIVAEHVEDERWA